MYTTHETDAPPILMSGEERERVREQLERVLETHHFSNSRRYPAVLRFLVEEALEGRGEFLKERLLGVRVFDRPADYDTAADPVVRVTIAEIRKRIAQYYHDEEHDGEIRIELHPGSYTPLFRFRATNRELVPEALATAPDGAKAKVYPTEAVGPVAVIPVMSAGTTAEISTQKATMWAKSWRGTNLGLVAAVAMLGVMVWTPLLAWVHPTAVARFWGPLLSSQHSILICMPTDAGETSGPVSDNDVEAAKRKLEGKDTLEKTFREYESFGQNVVYSDMLATLRMVDVLDQYHRDYRVRLNVTTNLEDLRQGPSVLVGGLDNQWTMRALAPLRFHMTGTDAEGYWVVDAKNPGNKDWSLDLNLQYGAVTKDYAIVARLHNQQTGQPQLIVAGIGMSGTAAAGELIGDERELEELGRRVGRGFDHGDFEVVVSTDIVNGIAGAPKILAVQVW